MVASARIRFSMLVGMFSVALPTGPGTRAATKAVDLDANPANGAESQCDLNVIQTFPVMVENKVTNRSGGEACSFAWASAGPGGFSSSVPPGTTAGVGAKWVWTTNQSVFGYTGNTCATDVCFSKTAGPDPITGTCSLACFADGIALAVEKGASVGAVSLSWPAGFGPYTLYRSTSPRALDVPANALATTDLLQVTDTPPAGVAFYYQVRAPGC